MKKLLLFLSVLVLHISSLYAQRSVSGHVCGSDGSAAEFATVVLSVLGKQAAWTATDTAGMFSLTVPEGEYEMEIRHISYKSLTKQIEIDGNDLGTIILEQNSNAADDVVVTANRITRESDRFVMTVANIPSLAGKDASELLALAPGVWINDNGISVNGANGTKVFVNERELRLDDEKSIAYLRTIQASEITRIEVIPQAGAEYSANSHGGIIKITLRRRQDNGMNGSARLSTAQSSHLSSYLPSVNVSSHSGKWTLNAAASGLFTTRNNSRYNEAREYEETGRLFFGVSEMENRSSYGAGRIGAIYDIDRRHSIGIEAEYTADSYKMPSEATTHIAHNGIDISTISRYRQNSDNGNLSASFNYIWKIDTIGSTVKLLADYTRMTTNGNGNYNAQSTYGIFSGDTTYRTITSSSYDIVAAEITADKKLCHEMSLKAGVKYTHNSMSNNAVYEGLSPNGWAAKNEYSYSLDYIEDIAAAYAVYSANIKRWSFSVGIRGEYSSTESRGSMVSKSYFGLFPSVSVNYSFNDSRTFMAVVQYSRNIERPSFASLNPVRLQLSEYTYQTGNPTLRPTYIDRISATAVIKYRYTVTVGANLNHDLIREVCKTSPDDPDITYITPENHYSENHYFVAVTTPFQLSERWTLTLNFIGIKQDIKLKQENPVQSHYLMFANATTGVTLPAKFYIELTYAGHSRLYSGNSEAGARHTLSMTVKKRLCNDHLTLSAEIRNITGVGSEYASASDNMLRIMQGYSAWTSRFVQLGITYSFNSGSKFTKRSVESTAATERGRMKNRQDN